MLCINARLWLAAALYAKKEVHTRDVSEQLRGTDTERDGEKLKKRRKPRKQKGMEPK